MRRITLRVAVMVVLAVAALAFGTTQMLAATSVGVIPDPGHPAGRSPQLPYTGHATPVLVDPAPSTVVQEQNTNNTLVKVFAERQDIVLAAGVNYDQLLTLTDSGVIPAGAAVSSYFIHFDNVGTSDGKRGLGYVTFDQPILGLITQDASLAATDGVLGSPTTSYPTVTNRGLELGSAWTFQDIMWVSADKKTLEFDLQVFNVLDQLRVVITGTTDVDVDIDIKPGSYPNCFNNDGHGAIPVAILGSATFDVNNIDPSTVTLDSLSVKAVGKGNKYLAHVEDVNGDGYDDLVVKIQDGDSDLNSGAGTADVTGQLYDGTAFSGTDEICIVP